MLFLSLRSEEFFWRRELLLFGFSSTVRRVHPGGETMHSLYAPMSFVPLKCCLLIGWQCGTYLSTTFIGVVLVCNKKLRNKYRLRLLGCARGERDRRESQWEGGAEDG